MRKERSLTHTLINISLVLVIILLLSLTRDFLQPLYNVILFILGPVILSLYVFYALRPLRIFLNKYLKSEAWSAFLTFLIFLILVALLLVLLSNVIIAQVQQLLHYNINLDQFLKANNDVLQWAEEHLDLENQLQHLEQSIKNVIANLPSYLSGAFSGVSNFATQLITGLLCLFYLLKDEKLLSKHILTLFRGPYQKELDQMGRSIHHTLKTYISGQLLVATILGGLMFIGFLIIRLPYASLMAVIALFTNFIPFIGPIIGCIPAILVAMSVNFSMILKVILVTIVVQQLESNVITPNIMGSKMDIHPFVVIVVVLICMNLFGILGALIATPLYITLKIIVQTIFKIQDHKKKICRIPVEDPFHGQG